MNNILMDPSIRYQRNECGQFVRTRFDYWIPETWDDGFVDNRGYFHVYRPDHPAATVSGWVRRHHALWWVIYGETIPKGMALHHRNDDKLDDRLSNLKLMTHGEHTIHHCAKPPQKSICWHCCRTFELPLWRLNEGRGRFCSHRCYTDAGGRWRQWS